MKHTPRGFAVYTEFKDTRGGEVRVQRSSAAEGRRVWIFSHWSDGSSVHVTGSGEHVSSSPHLSPAQARRVAKALLRFADGDD